MGKSIDPSGSFFDSQCRIIGPTIAAELAVLNVWTQTETITATAIKTKPLLLQLSRWFYLSEQLLDFSFFLPPPWRRCFRRCLSVCVYLLATLRKNFATHLHEVFREGWQWADEQMAKLWWRSGPGIRIRIRIRITIGLLVRRALAEVCTVPVLLVFVCLESATVMVVLSLTASKDSSPEWTVVCRAGCSTLLTQSLTVKAISHYCAVHNLLRPRASSRRVTIMKCGQCGVGCNRVPAVRWGDVERMDVVIAISYQFARDRSVFSERRVAQQIASRHVATIDYICARRGWTDDV